MASECGAVVVCRLACRMHSESCVHCSFDKQYKYLQIVLPSNSPNGLLHERELNIICFLHNQQDMNWVLTPD